MTDNLEGWVLKFTRRLKHSLFDVRFAFMIILSANKAFLPPFFAIEFFIADFKSIMFWLVYNLFSLSLLLSYLSIILDVGGKVNEFMLFWLVYLIGDLFSLSRACVVIVFLLYQCWEQISKV
jgi:hypothetical protein